MKYRVHFSIKGPNGEQEDTVVIEGDTLEEIRAKADEELSKRGGMDAWSEELP